jgi:hypothetical protein
MVLIEGLGSSSDHDGRFTKESGEGISAWIVLSSRNIRVSYLDLQIEAECSLSLYQQGLILSTPDISSPDSRRIIPPSPFSPMTITLIPRPSGLLAASLLMLLSANRSCALRWTELGDRGPRDRGGENLMAERVSEGGSEHANVGTLRIQYFNIDSGRQIP